MSDEPLVKELPMRDPRRGIPFRVNPDFHLDGFLLREPNPNKRGEHIHYLVDSKIHAELTANPTQNQKILDTCFLFRFYLAVEKGNRNYFLWPVRIPKKGEEMDPEWVTDHGAAELAKKRMG